MLEPTTVLVDVVYFEKRRYLPILHTESSLKTKFSADTSGNTYNTHQFQ